MSDLEITNAELGDADAISTYMPEAFGLLGGPQWSDPNHIARNIKICAFNFSSRQRITIARVDGYAASCAHSALALASDNRTALRQVGLIHGIATHYAYRRQGLARLIIDACERQLADEGAEITAAEVRPRAVDFFAACGYTPTTEQRLILRADAGNYHLARSLLGPNVLMWKTLPGHTYTTRRRRNGLIIERAAT